MRCAALCQLLLLLQLGIYVSSISTDPFVQNGETVDLPAVENSVNVSVFCRVTFGGNTHVETIWRLRTGNMMPREIEFDNPDFSNFVVENGTMSSNLTILSFSRDSLDMMVLECTNGFTSGLEMASFIPRFIEPPELRKESAVMAVVENSAFSFNISQSLGYPPDPSQNSQRATLTYQWSLDDTFINTSTSINPNVSDYPQIVFSSVTRDHSGNYSMTATTEAGSSTGYFILDVQYGVEATAGSMAQYCIPVGGNVTLVAFTNITGNPDPSSSWELIGGSSRGDTTSRELTITNVSDADTGNYSNTLSNNVNGTINQINRTVELRVQSLPTAPRNLAVINLTDDSSTSIILRWQNPLTSGVPAFNAFLVELVSMSPPFINVTRSFNATSTDPSNTFTVTGLKPNTNYTASVRAVSPQLDMSCMEQGVAHSQPSNAVAFMTMAGDPEFSATNLVNNDGKLVVTWSFKHTGGAPLTSVAVSCRSEEEGSGSGLASDMSCSANMCGVGMAVIPTGPENVTAGMNYSCTITVTNELGNSERQTTNYILATSGVPSVPMITDVTVGIQLFTVTVRALAGHTSLYFNVSVMNEQNSVVLVLSDTQTGVPSGPMNYMIAVPFTQSGRHRFSVSASNPFGRSAQESDMYPPPDRNGLEVIMPSSTLAVPSATSTSVTQPSSTGTPEPPPVSGGLGAGAVAAIVIVLIAVILIILVIAIIVIFFLYKNKGDSYKVDKKKGIKVDEVDDVDIGTELKPSSSDLPPAVPAPAEPPVVTYSAVGAGDSEPRAELHYADLQEFQKSDRQKRPSTKAPVEEVQYAVINPKSLKKAPEPAEGNANGEAAAAGEETEKAQTSTTFI